ncbi:virulence factor Mce family protein [Nocardioides scoriae]|uniref:Virulence factor Mce family protein n=1 Tax=Nocardioides scoriae TaxID=642780 RepID=A0A1H1TGK5_9ACTN|nr:MCE family protein [Nocardioides scoriae]SDS58669.1 virulence factor Mce family protein [Nocardioides scoriae]
MSPSSRPVLRRRLAGGLSSLVAGALLLSGCSVYDAPLPGGPDTGDNPIEVTARFRDVLDLVPQSTVKIDDVSVGKVTAVKLKGYVAVVTLKLPADVKLPDNATAQIRQTSLLGEKFVSLSPPQSPSGGRLSDGDVIGLDRTGRNPEVEEVFSALALLLNGGGVGQLKTIVSELNNTFDGREADVRSLLTQMDTFVGQLDENKASIVAAIENTNRLAASARQQDQTIKNALDDVPDALRSINRQRADLVRLLKALTRLSDVGVRVIKASKQSTINTLRDLGPVLDQFAAAGQDLPKALQVFLTYPFVDEAVGRDPQVARNLHMGDYTNLAVNLDLDVLDLPNLPTLPGLPTEVCDALAAIRAATEANVREAATRAVNALPDNPLITAQEREKLRDALVDRLLKNALDTAERNCEEVSLNDLLDSATTVLPTLLDVLDILTPDQVKQLLSGALGPVGGALDGLLTGSGGSGGGSTSGGSGSGSGGSGGGGLLGLPRAPLNERFTTSGAPEPIDPFGLARLGLDPGIGTMLLQGVAEDR